MEGDTEGRDTDVRDAGCCCVCSELFGCCAGCLKYLSRVSWEGNLPCTSAKLMMAMCTASSQYCLDCGE
eukprot:9487164-Ditylum_brightwellii.AAC.1